MKEEETKIRPQGTTPLKVGVTGGIGAGKSLVCKIFSVLGAPVYDADARAKRLMVEDEVLISEIKAHFGEASFLDDGSLNRVFLADEVFVHQEKLDLLNSLVHPRVALDFDHWYQAHLTFPYVIKEAALLFESGSYKTLDAVVVVSAPEDLRIRRTVIRDAHRSLLQVESIISKQLTEEERKKKAGYTVVNDEKKLLIPQVIKLHKIFTAGKFKKDF